MPDNFLLLRDYLTTRYAGESELRARCRHFVQETCEHYVQSGLADSNFLQALCCGDEARFWQRFSEALFASELTAQGLELHPSHNGPDFLVVKEGRKIWIEAICPEPIGIPAEWSNRPEATMITLPHEAILLRTIGDRPLIFSPTTDSVSLSDKIG